MHPRTVVYLEHDGKLLLVDNNGNGPKDCVMGRSTSEVILRFQRLKRSKVMEFHGKLGEKQISDLGMIHSQSYTANRK